MSIFGALSGSLASSSLYDFSKEILKLTAKNETVQTMLAKLGLSPQQNDFAGRYIEALVEMRQEGKGKTLLEFFRDEGIMQAFYDFYFGDAEVRNNEVIHSQRIQKLTEALRVGDAVKAENVDTAFEVQHFWQVFKQKVQESRTVKEVELRHVLLDLLQSSNDHHELLQQLQQWMQTKGKENLQYGGKIYNIDNINQATFNIILNNLPALPKPLGPPPFFPEVFLGRDTDLEAVHQKLFGGDLLLLLVNGEGGIGKTSLAAQYYLKYGDEYNHLAWVYAEKDIADALISTLAAPLHIDFDQNLSNEQRLAILLEKLRGLERPCLLVIDNANNPVQLSKHYKSLRSCPNFHVLLTTRVTEFGQAAIHKITPLKDKHAHNLFIRHYPGHLESENELLDEILLAVGKNTLVIELLAKNLDGFNKFKTKYSLRSLLADLQGKGLLGLQNKNVDTPYHAEGETLRRETPEAIIAGMYDLGEITAAEKALMAVFAALPAENIRYETLETLLVEWKNLDDSLESLFQKGWVDWNPEQKSFKISPVVQEIVQKKNEQLLEDCLPLIQGLIVKLHYEPGTGHLINCTYAEAALYTRYAENIVTVLKEANESLATLCERIGSYHSTTGDLEKALHYFEDETQLFEELYEAYPGNVSFKNGLAISYSKLGSTHTALGDLEKALHYFEDYSQLKKELYEAYPGNVSFKNGLAISYSKLGETHTALGDLEKALHYFEDYSQLTKELYEAYPGNVSFKNGLAISYYKLGAFYRDQKNDKIKAKAWLIKAKHLWEELVRDFPAYAQFHRFLAQVKKDLADL